MYSLHEFEDAEATSKHDGASVVAFTCSAAVPAHSLQDLMACAESVNCYICRARPRLSFASTEAADGEESDHFVLHVPCDDPLVEGAYPKETRARAVEVVRRNEWEVILTLHVVLPWCSLRQANCVCFPHQHVLEISTGR